MAIVQMQRINICALKKNRKAILERLQELGAMEIDIQLEDDNLGSHRERIWEATSVERPCSMYWYYSRPHLPNGYTAKLHTAYVTNFTVLDVIGTLWLINN